MKNKIYLGNVFWHAIKISSELTSEVRTLTDDCEV